MKNNIEIIFDENKDALIKEAQEYLSDILMQSMQTSVLFLSSGGSSLSLLNTPHKWLVGPHLTYSVLDERDTNDNTARNAIELASTHFSNTAQGVGASFVDPLVCSNATHKNTARQFEHTLRTWKKENPKGITVITQGIGIDGHTSGIMPFPESPEKFKTLFEGTQWVQRYNAGSKNKYPLRITTTITFLRDVVDYSIVYVVGKEKLTALKHLTVEEGTLEETPARVIREMKKVFLFTNVHIEAL